MLQQLTGVNSWTGFVSILSMFGVRCDSQVGILRLLAAKPNKLKEEGQ